MRIRVNAADRARRAWPLLLIGCFIVWIGYAAGAPAQTTAPTGPDDTASEIAQLKDRVNSLRARKDTPDSVRHSAVEIYQKAISALKSAQGDRQHARQLRQAAAAAPGALAKVQAQLRDLENSGPLKPPRGMSTARLSKRAKALQAKRTDAQSNLSDLRDALRRIAKRPETARAALAAARNKLQSLGTTQPTPGANRPGAVAAAQRALQSAKREALNAKIARLQRELASVEPREKLLEAKRSLAEAQVARYNRSLAALQTALGRKQHESAHSLQKQTESKLTELRGAVAPISQAAQKNLDLSDELAEVTQQGETLAQRQVAARNRADDIERRLNLVKRQLEIGGSSVALGDVLRAQKRNLASPALPFLSTRKLADVPNVAAAELRRFQLQQRAAALEDPAAVAKRLAKKAGVQLDDGQRRSLIALLRQRRRIVDLLVDAESRYVAIGRDLNALSQQYNEQLTAFNSLLNERLIWLPSFYPMRLGWFFKVAEDLPWALNPIAWQRAARALAAGCIARPWVAAAGLLALALLVGARRPLRGRLAELREPVGNVRRDSFWLTLRASVITLLLSSPGVVLLLLAGYIMGQPADIGRFTQAAAAGVGALGILIAFIEPFAQVCRTNGLADGHFLWPADARRGVHRTMRWLLALLVIPTLLVTLTEAFDDDAKRQTIGRAAFMVSALMIAWFSWRLLHPYRGVLANVLGADEKSHWRLGYLWLPLAFGGPLALCGLAAWGYYYTALQIQTRFFYSTALLGSCVVLYSLIVRWVTVAERRLALTRALRKREEARQARAARESASVSGDSTPDNLEKLEIDLVQISEQTRGLIQLFIALLIGTGLWLIWSNMLPALRLLDEVTLWHQSIQINGQTQLGNVTLGALLLALAIGVITALAGRNLPGFLEIAVLRRFSMNAGSRYAVATLLKYAIFGVGLVVAVNIIGLRWSSIQWLVAALGVGLGFGLQEIFANFVSGILILFERPVRVGDTVTVGDLTGTVSRIRLRATTITDWDNKEMVIPNRTFVSQTVVNWTLTQDIRRLILHMRVAFDSDTELAEKLIMDAIEAEPTALDEPAPSVFMVGYGDSALLYEARVFYRDLYNWLPLQHALYKRIHAAFAGHKIDIAFPQQDLHLRSVDASFARAFGGQAPDTGDAPRPAKRRAHGQG